MRPINGYFFNSRILMVNEAWLLMTRGIWLMALGSWPRAAGPATGPWGRARPGLGSLGARPWALGPGQPPLAMSHGP